MNTEEEPKEAGGKGYGSRRSVWKWLGIYLVVAVVLYTGVFYAIREMRDNGADDVGGTSTTTTTNTGSIY